MQSEEETPLRLFQATADEIAKLDSRVARLQALMTSVSKAESSFMAEEVNALRTAIDQGIAKRESLAKGLQAKIKIYEEEIRSYEAMISDRSSILESQSANETLEGEAELMEIFSRNHVAILEKLNDAKKQLRQ